ncbi:hypothetical protein [Planctomicrobium piriforme]|uniref:WXG100 family type VII secretion target n=1 Tax=Planctomicrobium piriforme TaxID=1576369 RepID=A0A1I3L630_9PLAN|nr:hypothetical protein [Planctomicrobium piriforme]SFI79976.1 hypothetical protein SAMN05421753_112146 [Planctomicrobium piriforme]
MRASNLQSGAGRIQEALEDLQVAWQATKERWSDQQAEYFEQTYMRRIAEEVGAAFPAIGQVSQTFGAAGRECSE